AGVPERIARSLPGCRLVYIVRDPIERIVSHYRHRWANGSERAAIDDAVVRDPVYLACSRYADQIGRYLDHFPRERLMVLTAEDLRNDRAGTMAEVFGFIGVDAGFRPEALVEEHYRAESRVTYPPAVWRLRRAVKHRVPAAKRAKEAVDSSSLMRRLSRWGGGSAADVPAQVSPALRSRLADELRDDVAELRPYMPDGWHGWGIA
ncbi:MAG TPA: sulfotransferase domain-containing protein, partial [Actinomycetota bacterium]